MITLRQLHMVGIPLLFYLSALKIILSGNNAPQQLNNQWHNASLASYAMAASKMYGLRRTVPVKNTSN